MRGHTVRSFDAELRTVNDLVRTMSDLAASQIDCAIEALVRGDVALAMNIVARDRRVDSMQLDIEHRGIAIIALRQPMGSDLCQIIRALRIVRELERIGDLAKNIAKRTVVLDGRLPWAQVVEPMRDIVMLLRLQLRLVLHGFRQCGCEESAETWRFVLITDSRHVAISRQLQSFMGESPDNIAVGAHLLFCAKNIEQMCDHVARIAGMMHNALQSEGSTTIAPLPPDEQSLTDASAAPAEPNPRYKGSIFWAIAPSQGAEKVFTTCDHRLG